LTFIQISAKKMKKKEKSTMTIAIRSNSKTPHQTILSQKWKIQPTTHNHALIHNQEGSKF
jgi:hypothetical protein